MICFFEQKIAVKSILFCIYTAYLPDYEIFRQLLYFIHNGKERTINIKICLNHFMTCFTTSTILSENPHSLSYQETTLTKFPPITFVSSASNMDEFGSVIMSTDTIGSSSYLRMPFNLEAASLNALFISSFVVFFSSSTTKSVT